MIRDLKCGLNARLTLASLILLTAISACGGGSPPPGTSRGSTACSAGA